MNLNTTIFYSSEKMSDANVNGQVATEINELYANFDTLYKTIGQVVNDYAEIVDNEQVAITEVIKKLDEANQKFEKETSAEKGNAVQNLALLKNLNAAQIGLVKELQSFQPGIAEAQAKVADVFKRIKMVPTKRTRAAEANDVENEAGNENAAVKGRRLEVPQNHNFLHEYTKMSPSQVALAISQPANEENFKKEIFNRLSPDQTQWFIQNYDVLKDKTIQLAKKEQAAAGKKGKGASSTAGNFFLDYSFKPGKEQGKPAGFSIRPMTLLKYMRETAKAQCKSHMRNDVPMEFQPTDTAYIPHEQNSVTGEITIPSGWSKEKMQKNTAEGRIYRGENPQLVSKAKQKTYGFTEASALEQAGSNFSVHKTQGVKQLNDHIVFETKRLQKMLMK